MASKIVENADITIFGQLSLIIFFAVFIAVLVRVWTHSREEMEQMAHLPIEEESRELKHSQNNVEAEH